SSLPSAMVMSSCSTSIMVPARNWSPERGHRPGRTHRLVMTPANGVGASSARPEQEDAAERLRGVIALPHERDILFTDEVEWDSARLPRWQPHLIVDERRFNDDREE